MTTRPASSPALAEPASRVLAGADTGLVAGGCDPGHGHPASARPDHRRGGARLARVGHPQHQRRPRRRASRPRRGRSGGPLVLGALAVAIVIGLAEPARRPTRPSRSQALAPGWRSIRLTRAGACPGTPCAPSRASKGCARAVRPGSGSSRGPSRGSTRRQRRGRDRGGRSARALSPGRDLTRTVR